MDRPASLMTPMARDILLAKKQKRQVHKKASTCSRAENGRARAQYREKKRRYTCVCCEHGTLPCETVTPKANKNGTTPAEFDKSC